MGKILVTGSKGVLGSVLKAGLEHEVTDFDLPEQNMESYEQLLQHAQGHDTVIHLAWNFNNDGFLGDNLNPDNALMSYNAFQASVDAGVKRIIVASSVHADKFADRDVTKHGLLKPFDLPLPDSPYGAGKCMLEALGRYYADSKGLEVICIRFGGVNAADEPPASPYSERQVWFSHRDCINLIHACIEAESIPYNYTILYGMSNNKDILHDLGNPFGWAPVDGAA